MLKKIGLGLMSFSELRESNSYYIDKTSFIKDIMSESIKSFLFTRPRRFGKTLTQSMLNDFLCLNYGNSPDHAKRQLRLFEDLEISKDKEFCQEHMGRHPVIFISFKNIEQPTYEGMRAALIRMVRDLYSSFYFLTQTDSLNKLQIASFEEFATISNHNDTVNVDELITSSLISLCKTLCTVYKRKVIVLIDEYDVPVNQAHSYGFYDKILPLIRGMLYQVVKDDRQLVEKCVITGCTRISRESIFTGMNSAIVYSVSDGMYSDIFGFTQAEVDELLHYYSLTSKKDTVKEWYDGYNFGGTCIYNPWDVTNYCYALLKNSEAEPVNYWANTSSNEIIKEFIDYADPPSLEKMQKLLNGETIKTRIDEQLVYPDLEKDHSPIQLFSILLSSGYLTAISVDHEGYELKIPNRDIKVLFNDLVTSFHQSSDTRFHASAAELPKIMAEGFSGPLEDQINYLLSRFISVRDTGYEIAYHTFFVRVLSQVLPPSAWLLSEPEAGDGFADITFMMNKSTGIILEFKKGNSDSELERLAVQAIKQAETRKYRKIFSDYPVKKIITYGIACHGKRAVVKSSVSSV